VPWKSGSFSRAVFAGVAVVLMPLLLTSEVPNQCCSADYGSTAHPS
jgi:hypothetical protein